MKKQLFCILFSFCALTSVAQIRGALIVGPHGASVTPAFTQFTDTVSRSSTQKAGIHIGFLTNVPLFKNLYLQTGLMYAAKGSKQQQVFDPSTSNLQTAITTLQVNYMDAPFSLMYKVPLKGKMSFIFGGGPQASLFYSGDVTYTTLDAFGKYEEMKEDDLPVGKAPGKYRTFHLAANAFGGLELGRVFLTANYSQSITPFYTLENQSFRHKTMGGTLGIFLGKQQPPEPLKKDKDGDGVLDDVDACPDEPGSAANNGCSDKDGDGLADKEDQCPEVAGSFNLKGCPVLDKDSDEVNDTADTCPEVAGSLKYKGCPVPDTDKDSLNDEEDQCPEKAGTAANKGCPETIKEAEAELTFAARQIQFEYLKAQLTDASYGVLNEVVETLEAHPQIHILVEGHTSGTGRNDAANVQLSQQRAENVKAYLVSKGIAPERVRAVGYGSSKPLNQGTNQAEKAKNRRVELKIITP